MTQTPPGEGEQVEQDQTGVDVEAGDDVTADDVTVQQGDEMVTFRDGVEVGRVTVITDTTVVGEVEGDQPG